MRQLLTLTLALRAGSVVLASAFCYRPGKFFLHHYCAKCQHREVYFLQQNAEWCAVDTIGKRIAAIRGNRSRDEFATPYGIHRNTLAKWESDQSSPPDEVLRAMALDNGIPEQWLLCGFVQNAHDSEYVPFATARNVALVANDVLASNVVMVPKVQARLSAGGGSLEANGDPVGSYAFRSDWLIRKGQASSMVLMDVVGDSMAPAIEDGDMVLIDQSQTGVVPGAIYAVGVEGGVYVKRVDLLPGVLVLNSINPSYSAIEVPLRGDLADTVRVIGRVIWWCREAK